MKTFYFWIVKHLFRYVEIAWLRLNCIYDAYFLCTFQEIIIIIECGLRVFAQIVILTHIYNFRFFFRSFVETKINK